MLKSLKPLRQLKPSDIGTFGEKFTRFRENQLEAAMAIVASDNRFTMLNAPPGTGKSFIYILVAKLLELRTCVLTVTTPLQTQLERDFNDAVSIMGMGRYECKKDGGGCDTGSCHIGEECSHRYSDCCFFSQVVKASNSKIVAANYSFWHYGASVGDFDMLVVDEADAVTSIMTSILDVSFSRSELYTLSGKSD